MKGTTKELVGASTSLLVLAALKRGPSYGYDIVREINREAGGLFTWQEGTIYPVLHKMEREGLVKSRWQEADTGRRRKYYSLTSAGKARLCDSARQWSLFHELVARCAGMNHA